MINTIQVGSGICYIWTYEKVKHFLTKYSLINDQSLKSFIGGGIGSLISQTIVTPFDVVSQNLMIISSSKTNKFKNRFAHLANPITINSKEVERFGLAIAIVRELYRKDGIKKGFYRGYFASLTTYVPSSALWWLFYEKYSCE